MITSIHISMEVEGPLSKAFGSSSGKPDNSVEVGCFFSWEGTLGRVGLYVTEETHGFYPIALGMTDEPQPAEPERLQILGKHGLEACRAESGIWWLWLSQTPQIDQGDLQNMEIVVEAIKAAVERELSAKVVLTDEVNIYNR